MIASWIIIFSIVAVVLLILLLRYSKAGREYSKQPHDIDLKTFGQIPINGPIMADPGDLEMITRLVEKLKNPERVEKLKNPERIEY